MTKSSEQMREERITWLRYEFAEIIERCERREINIQQLAQATLDLVEQDEISDLDDELLQQAYWAMSHATHRPACWAPNSDEIIYLRRCLRGDELFDPAQVEFSFLSHQKE